MATEVNIFARVRKLLEALDVSPADVVVQPTLTQQLELLVAQGAAQHQELTRTGRTVQVHTSAAIAAVVAIPTTGHLLSIYNNEPDGGRSFIVDWIGASNVVSTAVATQAQLLAYVGQVREAAPADAALTITKLNGLGSKADANILSILSGTALPAGTGLAANWFPWGDSVSKPGVAGTPGYGLWKRVDGAIIAPPGRYMGIHVMASVVGETFLGYIAGHMKQITNA